MLLLHPLVILHLAAQPDGHRSGAESRVCQRIVGLSHSCGVDQLAVKFRIDGGYILHVNGLLLGLIQHPCRLHRPAFIDPEQYCSRNQQKNSCADALPGFSETLAVTCSCSFLVSHNLMFSANLHRRESRSYELRNNYYEYRDFVQ